jgi:hypothetical protein
MTSEKIRLGYFLSVLGLGGLIFIAAMLGLPIETPPPWVTEWTTWLASYVGIGVTARGLWVVSDAIAKRIGN